MCPLVPGHFSDPPGPAGSSCAWLAWQRRCREEPAGAVICEQLAEAFVKGVCVDKEVTFSHFGPSLSRWRAAGVVNDCFIGFCERCR